VGLGRFFSIALFVVSARHFSVFDNGNFIFAMTLPQLVIEIGTLGWLNVIRREVSRRSEIAPRLLKGFVLRSFQVPMSAIVCVVMVLWVVGAVRNSNNVYLYGCIVVLTLTSCLSLILKEYLLAFSRPAFSVFAADIVPFAFGSIAIWLARPDDVETAVLLFTAGVVLSIAIQVPVVRRLLDGFIPIGDAQYETRQWSTVGGFALLGFGGRAVLNRLDIVVLSTLAPAVELAYYNSGQRLANLLLLAPVVVLQVFSPYVSKAFVSGDIAQLRRDMILQTMFAALCVLPLAALLVAFPGTIVSFLFGKEYAASGGLLYWIVFSQTMFAFSLPWSNLLLMSDGERIYGYAHIAVAIIIVPIAFSLVHSLGATAVAVAASVANVVLFAAFFGFGVKRISPRGRD
jgi:O-antigen/teichoic acid export membrane protein